ncbi:MAG TPA: carboxypeptidase-like regulatory domain-containing protein, partial [Rhodothermales bacterium]
MKLPSLLCLVVISLWAGSLPASAQMAPPGAAQAGIRGTVEDASSGQPIQTATVAVWSATDSTLVTGAVTDPDGAFAIQGLRPGRYYIEVSFIGYGTERVEEVELTNASTVASLGSIR